jgi:hypothetical protein
VDLRAFIVTLRRHKWAALIGLAVAIGLAFYSYVRVDPFGDPALTYRKSVIWGSNEVLQISQPGFYEGRVTADSTRRDALLELAPLYARLANSDQVRARMRRSGPILGGVSVDPVIQDAGNGIPLPLIEITAYTRSAQLAPKRAAHQARAFIGYLQAQQIANGIPEQRRVTVSVIKEASKPFIAVPRKKTLPVIVFLSMLIATVALVLVLENMSNRRNVRQAGDDEAHDGDLAVAQPAPAPVLADGNGQEQPRPLRRDRERRTSLKPALPGPTLALRPTLGSDEQSHSAEADG